MAVVAAGCGSGGDRQASPQRDAGDGARVSKTARFALERVGRFARPLSVAQPRDDPDRLFVVEKGGRVRVVRRGMVLRTPFLSLRGRVSTLTEQGLLGLAFAPSYVRTGLLYVAFTDRRGDLRVEEWRRSARSPDRVRRTSRRLVLRVPQPAPTHNGGHLVFGPDGLLYIGVGDGGGPGDPRRKAQNRASLLGKILRIDPRRDGRRRYHVPTTNPFVRVRGARDEVYALGLRNPWRFSFDRLTGALLIGDVGQESFEELDYRPRDRSAGSNFGWSAFEGNRRFNRRVRARRHVPPIHTYARDRGCSVIGGYVVRDPALRGLQGRDLYGDFCNGELRSLVPRAPRSRDVRGERVEIPQLSSFGEDAAGHVYVVSLGGLVHRLVPPRRYVPPMPVAILFYDVVLWVHVTAIVLAFGVTFSYPITVPFFMRNHPRAMPAVHAAQDRVGKFLITPAATIALLAGAYLATDRDYWSEVWVTVPMVILIGLLGLGGAFFSPSEKRAAELAARDVEAAGAGRPEWSPEYEALSKRVAMVGALASVLVLVALFFMIAKPGA